MNKTKRVILRCTPEERQVISDLARAMGCKQSEAIRRATSMAIDVIRGKAQEPSR